MTVKFNGKIDSMYNDLNGKFEDLDTHVKKSDTQVAQNDGFVKREEGFSFKSGKLLTPVLRSCHTEKQFMELKEMEDE